MYERKQISEGMYYVGHMDVQECRSAQRCGGNILAAWLRAHAQRKPVRRKAMGQAGSQRGLREGG